MRKLPAETYYRIHDPQNFYPAMRSDVKLLLDHRSYVSLTTVIVCCLDALAAGSGKATRGKFETFVTDHLPDLCAELDKAHPGTKGAASLYDGFRNGFAHLRGPKPEFAIAEDHAIPVSRSIFPVCSTRSHARAKRGAAKHSTSVQEIK